MYLRARINSVHYPTTEISITRETAAISIELSEDYHHALNAAHGSVYFKLLDDAAFFAVNSIVHDVFVLTTSFNLNLVRPVVAGKITAKGSVRYASRSIWTAEAVLTDAKGREIAFGTGNFSRSTVELMDVDGYKD